jgi:hypothetical protein
MGLGVLLYSLLSAGAELAASSAVGEFAKGAGKAAFDALKARLTGEHKVKSLGLLEDAGTNPAYKAAIESDLARPDIAEDPQVVELAQTLRAAIEALPAETTARYAIDIETIRAGGHLLFEASEGIRAKLATSKGDMTFKGIKAPPGK